MDVGFFRGTTVALITPFEEDGSVDSAGFRDFVDWQIEEGTDVLLVAGTTGEAATLAAEEHEAVMELVVDQAEGRRPVVCGTGSNSTTQAIKLTRYAESIRADGVLLVGPYYNKPTQEGFYRHFRSVAESTMLPVLLYNVPGRTGSNISAETTLRLAHDVDNIVGVKEASGNFSQIMKILRDRPENFLVLAGDDAVALPMISLGADGVVSVVGNQVPRTLRDMIWHALEGNWEQARELHYRLLPLMEANFIESNPIPVKTGLAMMGRIKERFRLPLVEMSPGNRSKLQAVMQELGLV